MTLCPKLAGGRVLTCHDISITRGFAMTKRVLSLAMIAVSLLFIGAVPRAAESPDDAAAAAVRKAAEQVVAAFNAAKADEVTALFLPKGELIDEDGTVYQGSKELSDLLTAFYKK